MKTYKIQSVQRQIIKLRESLRAGATPLNQIKRPGGMDSRTYNSKIARLTACEDKYKVLLAEGLEKWILTKN